MRIALIQTKQNQLYNFINQEESFTMERANRLQSEMMEQALDLIEKATLMQCDLIVTTEAINYPGSPKKIKDNYMDLLPKDDNDVFIRLKELARKGNSYLVAGLYHQDIDKGTTYNSAFIYNRKGEHLDCYHKIHLAGEENEYLTGGERFVTINADFGRFGVCICWDMQFPETARELAKQNVDLVVCPTWGWEQIYGHARAYENGVYVAAAMAVPYWMPIEDLRNPSEVVSPEGQVLARGSYLNEDIVICDVDITDCKEIRDMRMQGRKPKYYTR